MSTPRPHTHKPQRLRQVFQSYANPLYFITCVTAARMPLLSNEAIHKRLREYALDNAKAGRAMGRYVIMPDHLHFFVRLAPGNRLGDYVRLLKQAITRTLKSNKSDNAFVWQPGFFDHLLRNSESYSQKWEYVRQNPVRASLVTTANLWPYQGEIVDISL